MQKFYLIVLTIAFLIGCNDKEKVRIDKITIGEKVTLESSILGESREIWVHIPEGADSTNYPVAYLMDGDTHFHSVVGLIDQFSEHGNNICPKMIVVGILNTNRTRDFTPTHVSPADTTNTQLKTSGGGERFTDFIERELIPFIEKSHNTTNERLIIGHSLGGLMVINTLINRPNLFSKYVAIDPSLWWDNQKLIQMSEDSLKQGKKFKASLFIGIANTIGTDTIVALSDTSGSTAHFRSIISFVKLLKMNNEHGIDWNAKYYSEDTHSSVPLACELDALHFFYRKIAVPMDIAKLKGFEGRYESKANFIEVKAYENEVLIKTNWSTREFHLLPLSDNSLYSFADRFTLDFVKDAAGEFKQIRAFDEEYTKR